MSKSRKFLRRAAVVLPLLLASVAAFAQPDREPRDPLEVLLSDYTPIGEGVPLFGEALLLSADDGRVALGFDSLDPTRPLDGLADWVAVFEPAGPLAEPLYFQGPARVEFRRRNLQVVSQDGGTAFVLSVDGGDEAVQGVVPSAVVYRVARGHSLWYRSHAFEMGLDEVVARALEPSMTSLAAPGFTQNPAPPDDGAGGGGCGSSCSMTCGLAGSCTVACGAGRCSECICDEKNNPVCRCK